MKRITGTLLAVICVLVSSAGVTAKDDVSSSQAMRSTLDRYPGLRLQTDGVHQKMVYGRPMTTGRSAVESAEAFVQGEVRAFGVQPMDLRPEGLVRDRRHTQPLVYDRQTGKYKFTLVYYTQFVGDIPVFRSDLKVLVRNESDFPVVLANSSLHDLGDFEVDARVVDGRFDLAQDAVLNMNPDMIHFTEPEIVIWAGVDDIVVEPRLAILFEAVDDRTDASHEELRFLCDAFTGEILYEETLIHFVDVTGTVQAMATPPPKANICTEEELFVYPWARVEIVGGTSVYADGDGNFTIPNAGTSDVDVRSYVDGLYFSIDNRAGAEETLTAYDVSPPGPVDFIHNEANTNDHILAQTNIYVSGNVVRDWVLAQNPSFPGIATETGVPTVVNRTDLYCPCNAWSSSSDGSINFCQPGGSCPNTAWQSVLNHEYGHHVIDFTASGQGEYGEGMSDCFSVLPVDDPNLGYGFFGDCDSSLRTADNDCQYLEVGCSTCGSEIHDCGKLLSGCVWSIRNILVYFHPDYMDILSNITVNSILLHTGTGIDEQIPIHFLTIDDDDGNINNGTPHRSEICAGFSAHSIPCPQLISIGFTYPNGLPEMVAPGSPTDIEVQVVSIGGSPQPGTGKIHYSVNGGAFVHVDMAQGSPNHYTGTIPACLCGDTVAFYFSARDSFSSTVNDPHDAPTVTFSTVCATGSAIVFTDDFETDLGWTVSSSASDGRWDRGVPVDCDRGDPPTDYDGSGQCYLTDNSAGDGCNSDVDGGYTRLISPTLDLDNGNANIHFALWYTNDNGASANNDYFYVHISNNNGASWTLVESIGPSTPGYQWFEHEFLVSDYVTPTSQVKVRFEASDAASAGSVVEAGIDDFVISTFDCDPGEPTCEDGILNQEEDRIDCGGPCPDCVCLSDGECSDPLFCNGVETCDAYGVCQDGTYPCGDQMCDEVSGCVDCVYTEDCDDFSVCTDDTCDAGACIFTDTTPAGYCCAPSNGDLTLIDDDDPCTNDVCNANGSVSHSPNYDPQVNCCDPATGELTLIDDDDGCTDDVCYADGSVSHDLNYDPLVDCCNSSNGAQTLIDDGNECTDDTCNADGSVSHDPNYDPLVDCCDPSNGDLTLIDDDDACTDDVCGPGGSVTHDPNYNPLAYCCDPTDGDLTLIADRDNCTEDICNADGSVSHDPNYDPLVDCCYPMTGDLTTLDDGNDCTDDLCDPVTGEVTHLILTPSAVGEGARALTVTPQSCSGQVAVLVTSPDYPCLSMYVDADGMLVGTPVMRMPAEWADVAVRGELIVPSSTYTIQCWASDVLSEAVSATTWMWGDADNDEDVDIDDILLLIQAFQSDFSNVTMAAADLSPCTPNGEIDIDDILSAIAGFQSKPYADTGCPIPCE